MPVWVIPVIMAASAVVQKLISANAADSAMDQITGGFSDAQKIIKDSTNKSFEYLDPYLRGGQQDYNDYRQNAHSGYYDTPAPISYQPQAYQNQAVAPTGFDPATMSFGNSYHPMQFQPMGLVSSLALPQAHYSPSQPVPGQPGASGPAPQTQPRTPQDILIDAIKNVPRPVTPVSAPSSLSPTPTYNPQTGDNSPLKDWKPTDPRRPDLQYFFDLLKKEPWLKGGSGPYGLMGPSMATSTGGLR